MNNLSFKYFKSKKRGDQIDTQQKQRGYIVANQYGGPIDVTSWVLYKRTLYRLPNLYAGKIAYVYEDNEIYIYDGDDWLRMTNNHRYVTNGVKPFRLVFYRRIDPGRAYLFDPITRRVRIQNDGKSVSNPSEADYIDNEYQLIIDDSTTIDNTAIEARVYVKPNEFPDWIDLFESGKVHKASVENPSANPKAKVVFKWYVNNKKNPYDPEQYAEPNDSGYWRRNVVRLSEVKRALSEVKNEADSSTTADSSNPWFTTDTFETLWLICDAYYVDVDENGNENKNPKFIASSKLQLKNISSFDNSYGILAPGEEQNEIAFLTEKTSQLQRGYIMSSDSAGGIDATTSVNSPEDLDSFTNTYIGKLVYSYSDNAYKYRAYGNKIAFPSYSMSREKAIKTIVDDSANDNHKKWCDIGGKQIDNNLVYINESKRTTQITIGNDSPDSPAPRDLQRRYNNGWEVHFVARQFLDVNGVKTEVPDYMSDKFIASGIVAPEELKNFYKMNGYNNASPEAYLNDIKSYIDGYKNHVAFCGCVFYEWIVNKPTDPEYQETYDPTEHYDPTDYDSSNNPISGTEDANRDVWIRDVDYEVRNNKGEIVYNTGQEELKNPGDTLYSKVDGTQLTTANFGTVTYRSGEVRKYGKYLDLMLTNDYYDNNKVTVTCYAHYRNEKGEWQRMHVMKEIMPLQKEKLIRIMTDDESEAYGENSSGIKEVNPEEGEFTIKLVSEASVEDFVFGNENEIGYRITHYKTPGEAAAAYAYSKGTTGGTVIFHRQYDNANSVSKIKLIPPTPDDPDTYDAANNVLRFKFEPNNSSVTDMPFGWYIIEIFRSDYDYARNSDDADVYAANYLYKSKVYGYYQTITSTSRTDFLKPDRIWLGYYNLDKAHKFKVLANIEGTNLLKKKIPIVNESGEIDYVKIPKDTLNSVLFYYTYQDPMREVLVHDNDYDPNDYIKDYNDLKSDLNLRPFENIHGLQKFDDYDPIKGDKNEDKGVFLKSYFFNDQGIIDSIEEETRVMEVRLPDLDSDNGGVVYSVYKRPDNTNIFIKGTTAYDWTDPKPYAFNGSSIESDDVSAGVVSKCVWSYNKTIMPTKNDRKVLDFKRSDVSTGFEVIAKVNNPDREDVLVDGYDASFFGYPAGTFSTSTYNQANLTGKTFDPSVYAIKVEIEQPYIKNDSMYYSVGTDYRLEAHVYYSDKNAVLDSSSNNTWVEFGKDNTHNGIGTAAKFTWRAVGPNNEAVNVYFSNTAPTTEASRDKNISGTLGDGYDDVSIWFTDETMTFAYVELDVSLFGGYHVKATDKDGHAPEIKVRNPVDDLTISHRVFTSNVYDNSAQEYNKMYSGTNVKTFDKAGTRQMESEWIEVTVKPTLVSWFNWSDIKTTMKFTIDGEEVDESSTKYKISYSGSKRTHFYEGEFKVYWKKNDDMPDSTADHVFILNQRDATYSIPVELIRVTSVKMYPTGKPDAETVNPSLVWINAKSGTKQRYVVEISGSNLTYDSHYLSATYKRSSAISAADAYSFIAQDSINVTRDGNGNIKTYSFNFNDEATETTDYTVSMRHSESNQSKTITKNATTYVYTDDNITGFYTTSAYYDFETKNTYVYVGTDTINVHSSFTPSRYYSAVNVEKDVQEKTENGIAKFVCKASYNLGSIGITSGDNVLSKQTSVVRTSMSLSIDWTYKTVDDTFYAVVRQSQTSIATNIRYSWELDGPCMLKFATPESIKSQHADNVAGDSTTGKIIICNDSDSEITQSVSVHATMFYHDVTFTNWTDNSVTPPDYSITDSRNNMTIEGYLYDISVRGLGTNMNIDDYYNLSDLVDTITIVKYKRRSNENYTDKTYLYYGSSYRLVTNTWDLDTYTSKATTFSGTGFNGSGSGRYFNVSLVNTSTKSGRLTSDAYNYLAKATSYNGIDIKFCWIGEGSEKVCDDYIHVTSSIVKTSISISPSVMTTTNAGAPTISATVTLKGQNLKYASSLGNIVVLTQFTNSKQDQSGSAGETIIINQGYAPSIVSNASGEYSFTVSYTDSAHPLGAGTTYQETRRYIFVFGDQSATFQINFIGRRVNSITFNSPKYTTAITGTAGTKSLGFRVSANYMYGDQYGNYPLNYSGYGVSWSSNPAGGTITGYWSSTRGDTGTGTLNISDVLTSDTTYTISATRSGDVVTSDVATIKVVSLESLSASTSNGYVTYIFNIKNAQYATSSQLDVTYKFGGATLGARTSRTSTNNSDGSITYTDVVAYNNQTYHSGVARVARVEFSSAGSAAGQYKEVTLAAESPLSYSLSSSALSSSYSSAANAASCDATSATVTWTGTIRVNYPNGSYYIAVNGGSYSSSISFGSSACCDDGIGGTFIPLETTYYIDNLTGSHPFDADAKDAAYSNAGLGSTSTNVVKTSSVSRSIQDLWTCPSGYNQNLWASAISGLSSSITVYRKYNKIVPATSCNNPNQISRYVRRTLKRGGYTCYIQGYGSSNTDEFNFYDKDYGRTVPIQEVDSVNNIIKLNFTFTDDSQSNFYMYSSWYGYLGSLKTINNNAIRITDRNGTTVHSYYGGQVGIVDLSSSSDYLYETKIVYGYYQTYKLLYDGCSNPPSIPISTPCATLPECPTYWDTSGWCDSNCQRTETKAACYNTDTGDIEPRETRTGTCSGSSSYSSCCTNGQTTYTDWDCNGNVTYSGNCNCSGGGGDDPGTGGGDTGECGTCVADCHHYGNTVIESVVIVPVSYCSGTKPNDNCLCQKVTEKTPGTYRCVCSKAPYPECSGCGKSGSCSDESVRYGWACT